MISLGCTQSRVLISEDNQVGLAIERQEEFLASRLLVVHSFNARNGPDQKQRPQEPAAPRWIAAVVCLRNPLPSVYRLDFLDTRREALKRPYGYDTPFNA